MFKTWCSEDLFNRGLIPTRYYNSNATIFMTHWALTIIYSLKTENITCWAKNDGNTLQLQFVNLYAYY